MGQLIRKLLALLIPPVTLVYGFSFVVLALGGELTPVGSVVRRQFNSDAPLVYGLSYSNPVKPLKLAGLRSRAPSVAVLGTSRVLQFRAPMFKNRAGFYNAGGASATLWDLRALVEMLPRPRQPELLIVGLDQYLFNSNFAEFRASSPFTETAWHAVVHNSRSVALDDYLDAKFTLSALLDNAVRGNRVGLNAIMNNNGFRNDGSYHYGQFLVDPRGAANDDLDFKDTFRRIADGNRRFEYGSHVSREAIEEVQALLRLCRLRQIHVVAFLPPFAHQVYERMMSMPENYGYLLELRKVLPRIVAAEGFPLFDFTDLASIGASDEEMIDGFHTSERASLRVLLEIRRGDAILDRYVADEATLQARLARASPFSVFGDGEF